jgi:hypothetical protein
MLAGGQHGRTLEFELTKTNLFVILDGVKIAKRGLPGTRHAKKWIPLGPAWEVIDIDGGDQLKVRFNGETLIPAGFEELRMETHLTIAEAAVRYAQNCVDITESRAQAEDLLKRMIAEARKGNLTLRYSDNFLAVDKLKIRHKRDSRLTTRYVIRVEEVNGWLEKIGAPYRVKDKTGQEQTGPVIVR